MTPARLRVHLVIRLQLATVSMCAVLPVNGRALTHSLVKTLTNVWLIMVAAVRDHVPIPKELLAVETVNLAFRWKTGHARQCHALKF